MSLCRYDTTETCDGKERSCLSCVLKQIQAQINTKNRGTCDYFIVDEIEEIVNKYLPTTKEDTFTVTVHADVSKTWRCLQEAPTSISRSSSPCS